MTDWIEVLRAECKKSSQVKVTAALRQADGFPSRTVINKVLKGDYNGGACSDRLQALVEQHYMAPQDIPWIKALRTACGKSSQSKVARLLRRQVEGFPSPTVINQVLNGKYPSDKGRARLQALVEGRYMGVTIECPAMRTIGLDECTWWQHQSYSNANPVRVQMYRACRNCPNNKNRSEEL